jgi:lipid-A-disaccharide synthase
LLRYGVPGEKVVITGDPRHDAALMRHAGAHPVAGSGAHPRVTFLAGSRDSVFSAVFPFWVQTACALRARLPEARLVAVISPFVSPSVHRSLVARHRAMLDAARVELGYGGWPQVEGSDLVLTIPGSNTMELAVLRIPSMVVLPSSLAPQIPAEGLIEWVTRVPYAGPALRLYLARRYVQRLPYVALPNMRAGRRIMPELKGAVTPEQVAEESARLIRDEGARMAMVEALEEIPVETGASRRILEAMVSLWSGG